MFSIQAEYLLNTNVNLLLSIQHNLLDPTGYSFNTLQSQELLGPQLDPRVFLAPKSSESSELREAVRSLGIGSCTYSKPYSVFPTSSILRDGGEAQLATTPFGPSEKSEKGS